MLPFLLLLPVLCAVGFFIFSKKVCWKEFLVLLGAVFLVNVAGVGLAYMGATHDTELWNGSVTGKEKVQVACEHSYDCNCYDDCTTDAKGNQSCTTYCDTCYDHSHDFDWRVYTSLSDLNIGRLDSQGLEEPPRWTKVEQGEPVSEAHSFTNYIKAAPGTVLVLESQTEAFRSLLPQYPKVFDYYRTTHFIPVGVSVPNQALINDRLGRANGVLGPTKQVNVIVVAVKTSDQAYVHALEEHWLGGKKNDLIVVLGVPDGRDKIEWAAVTTWSEVELLKVKLRDELMEMGTLSGLPEFIDHKLIGLVGKDFVRKPMAEFAYLRYQFSPSPTAMFILLLLGLLLTVGLGIFFVQQDPFDSGFRSNPYRRRSRRFQ